MTASWHLLVAAPVGAVMGLLAGFVVEPEMGLLVAWGVAASIFLAWTWASIWSLEAGRTAQVSSREDPTRALRDVLLLLVAAASLVAVALVIVPAGRVGASHLVLGIVCIVASWLVVHTVFALKYARLFSSSPQRGIAFKQPEPPTSRDCTYVALTVGMPFQVADTDTQDTTIRVTVLQQALISFLFGAVILAVTVNVVAGLSR